MPFEDLTDDEGERADPGDEALEELAGTLSGESEPVGADSSTADAAGTDDEAPRYDPEREPAFPTAKAQTQHSVYCLPETWAAVDGASGLLFEAEVSLRRDGYEAVQKRELHNALLRAAAETLTAEDVAEAFVATRTDRADGPLLDEES
ncbi:hypothetical protein [Halegenticoccus soli]|uniref:hypothetical protein n=1 Tax=Halegenticoccus soli TaxID=1985678 RepID=UPI000C6DAB8B|nr:hypothetical protein [Halegenticoccus soli]